MNIGLLFIGGCAGVILLASGVWLLLNIFGIRVEFVEE